MRLTNPFVQSLDQSLLDRHEALRSFLEQTGDTPLIPVPGPNRGAAIFAKCEWANGASGTVKDRTVFGLMYSLLRSIAPQDVSSIHILEYTGGSLGRSLSRLCSSLGLPLTLVASDATHKDLVAEWRMNGTETVLVPRGEGFWGVMMAAKRLAAANPSWHFLYQHENPANLWMHRETTGLEIAAQLAAPPDAWVATIGTGATLVGVASVLARANPKLQVFAAMPSEAPYATEKPPNGLPKFLGSGGFGFGRKQPIIAACEDLITDQLLSSYQDSLRAMKQFYGMTGMRIGSSAAANWLAACDVATRLGPTRTVVTVFPSAATIHEWSAAETEAAGVVESTSRSLV